jgi:pimeloyl-ACP methyl ester carboxylesterase
VARVVASLNKIPLTHHFAAENKTLNSRPWIVITHHFGGSSTSSLRHVKVLTAMGFDCVTFDFSWHGQTPRHPLLFNVLDMWSKDIDQVLEQINDGHGPKDKILFSFSGPAASTLQSLQRRFENNKMDVKGLICDSGPFVDPKGCTRLMIEEVYGITQPLKREIVLHAMMLLWGPHADERLKKSVDYLEQNKPDLPLLSIRGLQDLIVPVENIRRVFENRKMSGLEILELESGHLTGLKDHPEVYKAALKTFLEKWI